MTNAEGRRANGQTTASTFRQIVKRQDEPFDSLTAGDSFDNLRDIRQRDVAIEEVVGLDQNANATGALIEAT